MLHFYIDGSCRGNGYENSQGGFGVVIFDDCRNLIDAYCEYFDNVTNNQMELKAFLKAFELLNTKYKNEQATIYSDSAYCINILTSWIYSWSKNNWKNSKNETIKNLDIILSLYKYYKINFFINQIIFTKVDGHKGNIGNELADALATADKKKFSNIILQNHININLL
jgi:ribonuclease HI